MIRTPDLQIYSLELYQFRNSGPIAGTGLNISRDTQSHYQGDVVCDTICHLLTNYKKLSSDKF